MLAFTSSFTSIQSHQGIAFHSSFHLPRIFPEKSRYSFLTIHDEAPGGTYHHKDDCFAREADTFNSDIRRDVKEYSLAATLASKDYDITFHFDFGFVTTYLHSHLP